MTRVVCLGFVVLSLIALVGCGATKQSYVAKGNKLFAAGKYQEAELNYRAALQKDAGYSEAYYRLGLAAAKLDQAREAYDALLHAVQLVPANIDARSKLADLCLGLYLEDPGHSQRFYTQIDSLARGLLAQNPNSYEGLKLEGYLASTDRKPKDAILDFRKALTVNSSDPGVVTELAHLLIQDGEVEEGEQLVANLIDRKKTSYGLAYDLLYSFYLDKNRPAEAENVLNAKVANNPKNADYVLQLARHYRRNQNTQAMTATLERLLNDPKDFPQARLWVGDFYAGQADYARAIDYYRQGAETSRDNKDVYQVRHVLAVLKQGQKDDAVLMAGEFARANPKDNALLRLHADLLLDQARSDQADVAVREFETLAAQTPGDVSLLMQLGRAYRLKGDLEGARSQFVKALHQSDVHQSSDPTAARYELAEIALQQQHSREAVEQAGAILSAQPNDRRARLLYATALLQTGDAQTARGVLTRLMADYPGDVRVFAALASAYRGQKQLDQARQVLHDGLAKWPDSLALLEQLADIEALSGHYEAAQVQYEKLLSRDPRSLDLLRRLGEVADRLGDHNRAIAYYQRAHDLAPSDAAAEIELADAWARASRMDKAMALYQHVAKAHPENAPALNNTAFFLADSGGDLDEALRLAKQALAKTPGQPSFSDTVGYIYLKKGMLDNAIQSFSTLTRLYPTSPSFRYHLALALYQKGDKAVARKELKEALANHPSAQETSQIRELLNDIS